MADPVRNSDISEEIEFPSQGTIIDHGDFKVDARGWVWALNHAVMHNELAFGGLKIRSASMLRSVAMFIADKIKVSSVADVRNTFEALKYLSRSEHFREVERSGGILEARLISDLRLIPTFAHDRLHYIRAWYCWCATQGMQQFSENVAERLREMKIGGNEHGHAVRTQDPIKGAFDELEYIALITKLRALGPARLTTQENTLAWLALAAGANPLAYALAREGDLETLKEHGTERIYARLNLPRIKKGGVGDHRHQRVSM
jgi:hypothetical protein